MKTMRFLLCLLPAIILAGCSSDDDGGRPERIAVQFSAGDITGLQSRTTAGGTEWTAGDPIGIFMVEDGQTLSAENIAEGADNVQYKALTGGNAQSGFTPVGNTIYYPQDGGKVDFIAYYPYKPTGTSAGEINNYIYPVDVSDQTKPEDIDVLYSDNATAKDKNSGTVGLQFGHALGKLSFTLTPGAGSPDLTGAKMEISSLYRTADMALADGSLSNEGSKGAITVNSDNYALVIPQTLSGTKLIITLADNVSVFEWTFTTTEFKAGKNHPYKITVDKTGITVTAGNITDWTGTGDNPTEGVGGIFYKVGDYWPDPKAVYDNGTLVSGAAAQGVVFWVDPADSRHGKAVGLGEKSNVAWSGSYGNTNANNMANGLANMATIHALANDFSDYPAFKWIHDEMNGGNATNYYSDATATGVWYLPSIGELQYLYCAWNNKEPDTWDVYQTPGWEADSTARANFNSKLTAASGVGLGDYWYWSSSENGHGLAWFVNFVNGLTFGGIKVNVGVRARCVLAF